jgi:succinate dehydrogenase/fumarate reductase flavoprotein subunit
MQKSGKGPAYMDCTETAQEDIDYMLWGLKEEGNTAMLDYMQKEGIDVRRHKIEFMQYEPYLIGSRGIDINIKAETGVEGLYAAGDEVGNFRADMSGAATFGWIAGQSAALRAKAIKGFKKIEDNVVVEERSNLFADILARKNGASWKEANLALQQIMNDYAGVEVRLEIFKRSQEEGPRFFGCRKLPYADALSGNTGPDGLW